MRGMVRHRLDIPIEDLREFTTSAQYALLGELSKLLCSSTEDVTPPPQSTVSICGQTTYWAGEYRRACSPCAPPQQHNHEARSGQKGSYHEGEKCRTFTPLATSLNIV